MSYRGYKTAMSNELIVGMIASAGLAAGAILIARFMILDSGGKAILQPITRPADRPDDQRVDR
jgi:hypothetical protein